MSVNGINGQNNSQRTGYPSAQVTSQSNSPLLGNQTGAEPTEEVPLVETSEENSPTEGNIPSPDTDPGAYADWLEGNIETYEDLMELRDQLEYLAERGDVKAAELLAKLNAAMPSEREMEDLLEELDSYADFGSKADLDGDGVMNKDDADIDGDSVTNEAEDVNGTNKYSTDTDGDQITDYGELWLKQHNYDFTWMDPTNPDANRNGIIDGAELPTSVTVDNNGVPIRVGAQPGSSSGDSTGTGEPGTASNSLTWPPASSDAQSAGWGQTVGGEGDVVVNLSGENVEFSESEDGKNLIITNKDTGETITIENYNDRRVYFEGTAGTFTTNNYNLPAPADTDGNGGVDTGLHFADGMDTSGIQNHYDPFNGSMPIDEAASTEEETVFNADGASGTFEIPSTMGGHVIEIVFEGNDVIVTVKDKAGGEQIGKKFRLKNGKTAVENGDITFQGTDEADFFYTEGKVTIRGGKGDDLIEAGAGSQVFGDEGNDYLVLNGTADGGLADGGDGDDVLYGSDGVDTLVGGIGNDAAYTGVSEGDTIDTGNGDDVAIVNNTAPDANYNLQMGGGTDMSNATNKDVVEGGSVDVRMDDLNGLRAFIDGRIGSESGAALEALQDAQDLTDQAAQMASDTVKDSFLSYLMRRKGDMETGFGTSHAGGFEEDPDTDVPPPPEDEPTPST